MKKILLLITFIAGTVANAQNNPDLIIKDVNVISMIDSKVMIKKSVAVKNGKIVQIDDFAKIKKGKNCKLIEAHGKFLMPGLAEMHSHLPSETHVDTVLMKNIAAGVPHLRVMNSELDQLALKKRL